MATRFWVGGTGTWDNSSTAHWAATTGGATGASVPSSADTVTLDGSSGGGTVTVAATINASNTLQSITCGAFTGTLDFSVNSPSITLTASGGFSGTGSGTRTINLGNGTWTMSAAGSLITPWTFATTTGLTFNANSSTLVFSGAATGLITFQGGGLTYNVITFSGAARGGVSIVGANTFATLNITAPQYIYFPPGVTTTITNAFAWTGTASNPIGITTNGNSTVGTISTASGTPNLTWGSIRFLTFSGGATFSATSVFDLGANTGITITAPTSGGGLLTHPGMAGGARG